ncbi:MAG: hypothetical protein L6437_11275 [Kiritimatiellae bacterium]|nr:hypothetical protein [Verrucomicrobiota bacterium]MCG2660811.1 hypothetical protein [Kiritimatiellia bacterium]
MKRIVVGLLAVCLLGSLTVLAEEKATTEKASKKEVVLQDITATGKLAKLAASFTVKEADGTVVKVMAPKVVKGEEAPAVTLEALNKLVGKDVKVVGKGTTKTSKAGKKSSVIKTVTSIEEATAPAAEAPAAEAPAVEVPAAEAE